MPSEPGIMEDAKSADEARLEGQVQRVDGRPPADFVCLEVTDTGTGIGADDQERIFEAYLTTKGERGTGLGLASVRESLRALGGEVVVESGLGKGCRAQADSQMRQKMRQLGRGAPSVELSGAHDFAT